MIKLDDYWNILNYLRTGNLVNNKPEDSLRLVSENEKVNTTQFFKDIIDQSCFSQPDYLRLRQFLIDWYSSLKTITTIQKNASDIFLATNDQVDELFNSFGYTPSTDIVPLNSKATFFLDLVNFYKMKGTPQVISNVLDYYGFADSNILEYWLLKDNNNNLVFRPSIVKKSSFSHIDGILPDVSFTNMTTNDPHWYYTPQQINNLLTTNKISLPSKTPYFSLTSSFYLRKLNSCIALMSRISSDEYQRFLQNLPLRKNLLDRILNINLSLLETYLAAIYSFDKIFGNTIPNFLTNLFYYNANDVLYYTYVDSVGSQQLSYPINLDQIQKSYSDQISTYPSSRQDRQTRIENLDQKWTMPSNQFFLNQPGLSADNVLNVVNPDLKSMCDIYISENRSSDLIYSLILTLDYWIKQNVSTDVPSLLVTVLGTGFRNEVSNVIEFFKPYRARLAFINEIFIIDDKLHESVVEEDSLLTNVFQYTYDYSVPLIYDGDDNYIRYDSRYYDNLELIIVTQYLYDHLSNGQSNYDSNGIYDSQFLNELIFTNIISSLTDNIEIVSDELINDIYEYTYDYSVPLTYDGDDNYIRYDSRYYDNVVISFLETFYDYLSNRQSNYDSNGIYDIQFLNENISLNVESLLTDNVHLTNDELTDIIFEYNKDYSIPLTYDENGYIRYDSRYYDNLEYLIINESIYDYLSVNGQSNYDGNGIYDIQFLNENISLNVESLLTDNYNINDNVIDIIFEYNKDYSIPLTYDENGYIRYDSRYYDNLESIIITQNSYDYLNRNYSNYDGNGVYDSQSFTEYISTNIYCSLTDTEDINDNNLETFKLYNFERNNFDQSSIYDYGVVSDSCSIQVI